MKFILCLAFCFAAAQAGLVGVNNALAYSAPFTTYSAGVVGPVSSLYNAPLAYNSPLTYSAYSGYPSVYSAGLSAPTVYSNAAYASPLVRSAAYVAPTVYSNSIVADTLLKK